MSIHYTQENDVFVMHKNNEPFLRIEEIAVAVEVDDERRVIVHKHGSADFVRQWAETAKAAFNQQGLLGQKIASQIQVIEGPFDVNVLNDFVQGAHRDFVNRYIAPTLGLVVDVNAVEIDNVEADSQKSKGFRP